MADLMKMRGSKVRESIQRELSKIIKKGAKGVVMVNPDGFIFLYAGEIRPLDEALAAYMMVLFPRARKEMKRILKSSLGALLQRDAEILDLLGHISLTFADQKYIGVYAEDYAILASVSENADPQELRTALARAIIEIIGELRILRELTMPKRLKMMEMEEYPEVITPTAALPTPTAEVSVEEREKVRSPSDVYKNIKRIILDIRRDLRKKGSWDVVLLGLEKMMVQLTILVNNFPQYGEHPAIKSIMNWISTTSDRIRRGIAIKGQKTVTETQREKLEKSLIQILNYLRKLLHLGER